jgi:hypothetical protein
MARTKELPLAPLAARAPAVIEQRAALRRELSDLKQRIAETALAAYEGKAGGREALAALGVKIRACEFQIDCNAAAHELALRLDRDAVAARKADVRANPAAAVKGFTKTSCGSLCSQEHGCAITGEGCAHPVKVGGIDQRLMGNQNVRDVFRAAAEKVGVAR